MNGPNDFHENMSLEQRQEKSILLVEDDDTMRELLALNLDKEGYSVITAATGPSLTLCRENHLIN
ncbi:MAG: hypothetical protein OES12_05710 [Anaerolineae bacterium]|nr:hypothetical protein [Anaerolineae bacterium]